MGDSNTISVDTELGVVNVHKMPLRDYAELLRALKNLPSVIAKFTNDERDVTKLKDIETFELIRDLLMESWDDLLELISVPTDKDADFLGKLDGPDAIDVIDAIIELNDIPRIIAAIKKIAARAQKMQKPKAQS